MNVSVVIPMYNREKTIESAIMSVLNQTVQPLEIIVVDDCSMDESVKIVRRIRKENKIVRLLRLRKNQGAQIARNCGIKAARGDWILFLDSDDELIYNAVEIQQETVEKNPGYDVYYGDYYRNENGKKRYINCRMKGVEGDYFPDILFGSKVLFPGLLVKKSALEEIGLLDADVPAYQEWDTNIRLSLKHKYYYMHEPLVIYNIHTGETISKDLKRAIKGFRYVVMSNGDLFLAQGGIKSIIFYYDGMYLRYKMSNDCRQFYYLCMKRVFQFLSAYNMLQDKWIKIIGKIWKLEVSSDFSIVSIFQKIIGERVKIC